MNFALLIIPLALAIPAKNMDTAIDGRSTDKYHESRFDPKKKLYLYSTGDCDGAHRRLTLTKDFTAIMKNEGYHESDWTPGEIAERTKAEQQRCTAASLPGKTDRGVMLGMTPAQVQKILGKPDVSMQSKKFSAFELIYKRNGPKDKEGIYRQYKNYYLFRDGKLFYIELANDMIGGA